MNQKQLKSIIDKNYNEIANQQLVLQQSNLSLQTAIKIRETTLKLKQAHAIIHGNKNKIDKLLQEFLAIRWNETKGTYLSYTSITPFSKMSMVGCAIAEYLAQKNNQFPLAYLMPTLEKYIDNSSRDNINNSSLTQILFSHISSDNNKTLIPLNILC